LFLGTHWSIWMESDNIQGKSSGYVFQALQKKIQLLRGFAGFLASVESDSIPCIWPVWMFVTDRTHNSILFYVGALFF
jgi:hypothetical protein